MVSSAYLCKAGYIFTLVGILLRDSPDNVIGQLIVTLQRPLSTTYIREQIQSSLPQMFDL